MQEIKIKSIKKINKKDRYDLTVSTTNNFFANNILIHNTSAVFANIPTLRPLKWWEKMLVKLGANIDNLGQ